MSQSEPGKLVAAGLLKLRYVLNIARKDQRFLNDLTRDPFKTLVVDSGIDLSTGEVMAILDIVEDTSKSPHAPFLKEYREYWKAILEDKDFKFKSEENDGG